MNPATPGPLTILLVPPPGDTALLADEAGGTVPAMRWDHAAGQPSAPCPVCGSPTRWFRPPTDQMDPCYICTSDAQHRFDQPAVTPMAWQKGRNYGTPSALLLVLDGATVAMGIDRAARTLTARTVAHVMSTGTGAIRAFGVQGRYKVERRGDVFGPWGVLDLCDAWTLEGARVVLLRDGREVES